MTPFTTIIPISTRVFNPPKDDVTESLLDVIPKLSERSIIAVTSKIVAIDQGRTVKKSELSNKDSLIISESDAYIPKASSKYGITLSIKDGVLVPSAGIDESNGAGYYILWPTQPSAWAKNLWLKLKERDSVKELGIIVADSHLTPLRWGTTGIAIGCYGFNPLKDYRRKPDIFGKPLEVTQSGIADSIAAAAVGIMGEGSELTPLALINNWPSVVFTEVPTFEQIKITQDADIFAPLMSSFVSTK